MITITDERRNEIENSVVNLFARENLSFKDSEKMCFDIIRKLKVNSQVQSIATTEE